MQYGRVTISVVNVELTHRDDFVSRLKKSPRSWRHTLARHGILTIARVLLLR